MQREILKVGHPHLRTTARALDRSELARGEVQALIDDMIETMNGASGAGLAATQVGADVRICVAQVAANERYPEMPSLPLRVWVNPIIEIVSTAQEVWMYEGCLSIPDLRGLVKRPAHVRVRSWDRHGEDQVDEFDGVLAAVAGHECDHLDGVLFVDRADPKTLCRLDEYAQFVPPEERIRIVAR